ncbi:Endopeptidase incomplete domain containing protein [Pandoravirus macleodensis]|uniref:Endopeptidase incomplete domain containing protein n=1 Tax=Pandoravirus macleodensis TaxID=2107707 RepID=A0A2U7UES9_9VIRU|nr:Endopeptidase incomplete domain containing protein [Pandoravirus macleodensis]AVK76902.1 Endopeptidase incomplete domain containing protein [Pandoravirus macleodensis]
MDRVLSGGSPDGRTRVNVSGRGSGRTEPDATSAPRPWAGVILAVALLVMIVVVALAGAAARMRRYVGTPPAVDLAHTIDACPLRTGDLIITSNHNGRQGRSLADWSVPIKWITGSPFNHVAVVYVEPDTRQLLFWEINGSGTRLATVRDLTCGRPRHDIFVRCVSPPIDAAVFERAMAAQWEHEFNFFAPAAVAARLLGSRQHHAFYARSLINRRVVFADKNDFGDDVVDDSGRDLDRRLKSRATRGQKGLVHRRTCAHMIAELYHLVGVLDYAQGRRGIDPAALCAGDFAKTEPDPDILPMARDYRFGPVTRLEW